MSDKPLPSGPSPSGDTPLEGEDRRPIVGTRAARYPEFDGGLRSDGQSGAGVAQPEFAMQTDENGVIVKADPNRGTGSDGEPDTALGVDVLDQDAANRLQQSTIDATKAGTIDTVAQDQPEAKPHSEAKPTTRTASEAGPAKPAATSQTAKK